MNRRPPSAGSSGAVSQRLAAGLARIGVALRGQAWTHGASRGLTPTQAQVLALVRARGPIRLTVVADELAVTPATASAAVAALARKGLVEKRPAPDDGRAIAIHLTPAGRREAQASAEWPDALLEALEEMSPGEQAVLLRLVGTIIRGLQERGAIPIQRMCVGCRYFRPNVHDDPGAPHHCDYVDAPFGDLDLRLDCRDFESADARLGAANWQRFVAYARGKEGTS